MAKKNKAYEFETLEQIQDVINKDNIDNFIVDFKNYLNYYIDYIDKKKAEHPEFKDKKNSELIKSSMMWIDDGKNNLYPPIFKEKQDGISTIVNDKINEIAFTSRITRRQLEDLYFMLKLNDQQYIALITNISSMMWMMPNLHFNDIIKI